MKRLLVNKLLLALALIYTVALLVVSLIRVNTESLSVNFHNADKVFHFGAYCGLALLWMTYFNKHAGALSVKTALRVCLSVIFFGIIIEVLQGTLTDYRGFDYLDILADFSGAVLAFVLFSLFKRKKDAVENLKK